MEKPDTNTVVVAMSGGVDSSVAAALLREQGFTIIGVTMKMFTFDEVGGNVHRESSCCGLDSFNDARMVAVKLNIPHYILDVSARFGSEVIDNFVEEYKSGRTPNPCVICNRKIKWNELFRKADELGARYIATGHYARVLPDGQSKRFNLLRSNDPDKDQTYALWGLSQEALGRTIFPLGGLTKKEVRQIAAKYELKTASKKESFEICFVADNDYRRFLKERFARDGTTVASGDLILGGSIAGRHGGIPFYTIGQRSGIGAHGEKMYVSEIDSSNNLIRIGRNSDLMGTVAIAGQVNFISVPELGGERRVQVMVRYRDTPSPATVSAEGEGKIRVVFDRPKRAITPGQSLVMYDGETLIGGGIIENAV